jgi:hypothetical protein
MLLLLCYVVVAVIWFGSSKVTKAVRRPSFRKLFPGQAFKCQKLHRESAEPPLEFGAVMGYSFGSRDVIALAVIMAMLVREERQPLAMQSIALLTGQLFGWYPVRALEKINICLETWKQDGYRLNVWKDEQGVVHVRLPKKMTKWEEAD